MSLIHTILSLCYNNCMAGTLTVIQLGEVPYRDALEIQYDFHEKRHQDRIGDTLLLLQHPPVITMGRTAEQKDILLSESVLQKMGVDVVPIERGGEVTYHGPGQIVGYLFLHVQRVEGDIGKLIFNIEEIFIRLLQDVFSIEAGRDPDHRGVWIRDKKITAVGIAVRKRVTFHGFAFNVNTDLNHFKWIVPCGIQGKGVTSLKAETGKEQDIIGIGKSVAEYTAGMFGFHGMDIRNEIEPK